jgi:hypothetical protein
MKFLDKLTLVEIAKVLDVDVSELLNRTKEKFNKSFIFQSYSIYFVIIMFIYSKSLI